MSMVAIVYSYLFWKNTYIVFLGFKTAHIDLEFPVQPGA